MTLYSIINAWADTLDLLPKAIDNHLQFSDGVIVVFSRLSNKFNDDGGKIADFIDKYPRGKKVVFEICEPERNLLPVVNETRKRNHGINYARGRCSHFFLADADEFYFREEVQQAKKIFDNPNINGIVCGLKVYISKPTLWCEDHTLVSFIHKMKPETYCGGFREYPYAYDEQGKAHIDPTRRINETRGVVMTDVTMHHYSYVRQDIDVKIDNSSANLGRSRDAIKRDLAAAAPGYKVTFGYNKELKESPNYFGL